MHYDVVIVGSGPAGSAAAVSLARKNYSVLVLEKSRHPRHKSCGGGLSARLLPHLDEDIHQVLEREVFHVSFSLNQKRALFPSTAPVAYLTRRSSFDSYLMEKAKRAGAEIREETPLSAWREHPDGVEVESRTGRDTASFLIAADGANSRIARRIHPTWKKELSYSVEQVAPALFRMEKEVHIDLSVSNGYGWLFPKASEAAVGIAGFKGKGKNPRALYSHFLKRHSLLDSVDPVAPPLSRPILGCAIPLYRRNSFPLAKGRVLLTGDAAGLVDPLFGEGIYYAVRSGQMAARAVADALSGRSTIEAYHREVVSNFYPEFDTARKMANWIYAFPRLFLEAITRHPRSMELYFGILRGERSYQKFWREVQKEFLLKLIPFRRIFEASNRP